MALGGPCMTFLTTHQEAQSREPHIHPKTRVSDDDIPVRRQEDFGVHMIQEICSMMTVMTVCDNVRLSTLSLPHMYLAKAEPRIDLLSAE